MKKIIVTFLAGFMLVATLGYAGNGDLVVNGKIGIGMAGPNANLQIGDGSVDTNLKYRGLILQGGFASSNVRQQNLITFGALGSGYFNADPFLDTTAGNDRNWHVGSVSDSGYFQNNRFSFIQNGIERLVIKGGSVGIGTAGPNANLQIGDGSADTNLKYRGLILQGGFASSNVRQQNLITFGALGSGYYNADPFLDTIAGNDRNWHIGSVSDSGYFQNNRFSFIQNGIEQVYITSGSYKLFVNGAAYTTDNIWHTSDERYKKNIIPVQKALSTLLKMEGVSYEWKKPEEYMEVKVDSASVEGLTAGNIAGLMADGIAFKEKKPELKNFPEGRQYGVLAQAMEKVLPEVVRTDNNGDKAVNYSGIIPILIEAVKEQQAMIVKQQQMIDLQQVQLNELRQMLVK